MKTTPETAKHTPAPWHVHSNYKGGIPLSVGSLNSPHGSVTIARVDWLAPRVTDRPSPEAEANAAHIVLCVNSHDHLVKALENALEALNFYDKGPLAEATIKFGRDALAAAQPKP